MELYIEKETSGKYGLVDTFIDETVSLIQKQPILKILQRFLRDLLIVFQYKQVQITSNY